MMKSDINITMKSMNQTIKTNIINELLNNYSHFLTTQAAPNMGPSAALLFARTGAQINENVKFSSL